MIETIGVTGKGPALPEQRLRQAAVELEGVFYAQLFQAMREAVPAGEADDSSAEQLFTAMFDQEVANLAAAQGERGLADAIYRQLSRQLKQAGSTKTEIRTGAGGDGSAVSSAD